MGIESALYTGVSGLDAMSQELSVIGNNISNSNTVGFKAGNVTFANLLSTSLGATSSTQTGNGVSLEAVGTDFSQGTLQTTSNPLDLAIQGSGFFTVKSTTGSEYFTRAGQFSVDQSGNIVDPNGDFLQGNAALTQPVTSESGVTTAGTFGASGNINISQIGTGAPTPTTTATIFANLLSSTQEVSTGTFNISSSNSSIVVSGSALAATTVTIPIGNGVAASTIAAEVQTAVNSSSAVVAAYGATAISVTYNSSTANAPYEFTINNVSAVPLTFDWESSPDTAGNVLGFSGTTTLAATNNFKASGFPVAGFDPNNANGTFSTAITVYDSGGNSHLVNVYFENIGSAGSPAGEGASAGNQWMWWAVVPSSDSSSGAAQVATGGVLDFTNAGALYQVSAGDNNSFNFSGGVAQNQPITFDFGQLENETVVQTGSGTTGTTEYGSPSSVSDQYQNGYAAGSLSSFSVSQTGVITGTFTNGQTKNIAQIQLARFNAPNELTNVGNNLYTQSSGSGQPIPGLAGNAGFGAIFSDSLEESNVDLSGEFVNMITVQSAYEADAKVISTAQELFTALQQAKQ
jgi:flagellar hook protein FlgE